MKNTKRTPVKILSMILVILITLGMVPTSAFASDTDLSYTWETGTETNIADESSEPVVTVSDSSSTDNESNDNKESRTDKTIPLGLSDNVPPQHWIQEYQEWALEQSKKPSLFSYGSATFDFYTWGAGGSSDRVTFGNTAFINSPLPNISIGGETAFCAEFNGKNPTGNYTTKTEGNDPTIKKYLANYDASSKGKNDYIAMQMLVWAKVMGSSVASWGSTGASTAGNAIISGNNDSSKIKYWILSGGQQNIIIYTNDDIPTLPPDPPIDPPPTTKPSSLTIEKKDARTGQALAGATFEVRRIDGGSIGSYTTNSSGKATLNLDIPPTGLGLVITEISPPAGYYLSEDNVQDLYISYGQASASVTFVNDPAERGELVIYKLDAKSGQVLAGGVFEVRNASGGVLGTVTTNSSGMATLPIQDVPREGISLIVEEVSPPPNYYLSNDNVKDVHIPYGSDSASVTFVNDPVVNGEITIYKKDAKTGQFLAGCVLEVRNASGGVLGTVTTDSTGKATLAVDIPREGTTLIVEEKVAPPNYYLSDDNIKDVHIPYGQTSVSVTFANDPVVNGEIIIYKRDAKTNALLAGCVLEVREINGGVLGVVTTDASGKASLPVDIPREGLGLVITELSPPPGYYLAEDNVKDVFIPYGHTSAEVTFVNDPILKSELRILKISEAGTPVPNTEFEVRAKDSAISTTVTTGADGIAVLTETPPTWYTVTEKSVPEPYILDTTPQVIQLIEGETHRLTFTNKSKSEVVILKTDVKNKPLAGAIFEVKYKDNGTMIGEFTSDANGKIVLTGVLPDSWITITEKSAPDGYVISTETKEIQVASDSKTEVHFVNNQKPKLQLKKVDEQDNSTVLKDAIFKISYKNGGTIGTFSTNENGIIFLEDLEPNQWVTIEEIQAPEFYLENDEIFEVFLEVDKTAEIIITNKRKPTIELEKRDSISKQPLQFARFLFERLDENTNSWVEVGTYTTNEQGMLVVENLDHVGRYRYTETKSPNGYHEDTDPVEFIVEWGKKVELIRENTPKHPLVIKKIDSVTGQPLAGVHFRILKANGEFVADAVTGRNGYIIVPELDAGFYQIFETKTLPNYILDETIKTVEVKYDEPCVVEFENKPLGSFLIKKISAGTDKAPLAGAEFKLSGKNGEYIGTYTTDVNGECLITNLEPNWYTIVEAKSPDGFTLDSTPFDFQITWGGILTRTFVNKPETGIHILKKNKLTGNVMEGISFRITKITGEYVGDYKTDSAGRIYSGKLDSGYYYVTETETLPNFKIDSVPRLVEIKAGEHSSVLYENIEYPTLLLKKTDKENSQPLGGVKFRLYDDRMREIGTYTTNDLGMLVLTGEDGITEGKYFLQEIEPKAGYVLDEKIHEIRLFYGKTTTINVKNTRNATLRLKKVDKETGEPLYNVEFILMDSKNNVLGIYTTNQNGEILFPAELKAGKYKIRENKTLPTHVLDETIRDVILKEGETTEIVWENQRKEGKIQITKVSSGNNEITKDKESKGLENVEFEVYNNKMELVDTIKTTKNGIGTSKYLPLGIYGIKEISPADYFVTDGEMFYAEIKIHDDLVKFTVKNDPVTIKTTVEKRGNAEVQSGDSMYYEFSNIKNESTVPLEDFYIHDVLPTDAIRLEKIWAGTWSERSKMEVQIKTNMKPSYRTIKTGLLSDNNNEIDCSPSALGLASNEYVTEFKIVFKQEVGVGFHNTSNPKIQVKVMDILQKDKNKLCYQFTNKVDVGGRYLKEWTYATDGWTTTVWCKPKGDLPKTGLDSTAKKVVSFYFLENVELNGKKHKQSYKHRLNIIL